MAALLSASIFQAHASVSIKQVGDYTLSALCLWHALNDLNSLRKPITAVKHGKWQDLETNVSRFKYALDSAFFGYCSYQLAQGKTTRMMRALGGGNAGYSLFQALKSDEIYYGDKNHISTKVDFALRGGLSAALTGWSYARNSFNQGR